MAMICAVTVGAPPAHAQRTFKTIGKDFEHGVRDILHV